ncbi:MAG: efflux RND transporter periplasmic adaptor subunit [Candidatus Omnitrophica bacterium]|nr:efflux RND transporter periplasmic adaptor subunit [Candidatus Omnitrophota bacterium]
MRKASICILVIFIAAAGMAGCGRKVGREKAEEIPVRVMKAERRPIAVVLDYVGSVKGQDEAVVYPKVPGKVLEKVKEERSPVKKGEPIVYIDRDEVGMKFEKAPVESPLDGILGRVYVDIGSQVTPQTPIALVSTLDKVEIYVDIPEKYLPRLKLGQEVTISVDAYPGKTFTGAITEISALIDTMTRSAPVQVTVDNEDHRLKSGMFAKVRMVIDEHRDAIGVLREALIGREPDVYAYIVNNGRAWLRRVKTGIRQGSYYEILGGIDEGDVVVIMGQHRLRDGSLVKIEEKKIEY